MYALQHNGIDPTKSYIEKGNKNVRYESSDVGHYSRVQKKQLQQKSGDYEQRTLHYNVLTPALGNENINNLRYIKGVATDGSTFKNRVSLMNGLNELSMHRRSLNPNNDLIATDFGYKKERGYLFRKELRSS